MTTAARDRSKAWRRGRRAEWLAAWYLRGKGYRVLERRYRTGTGEVDIVARRGTTLAFVEVKARATLAAALEAVPYRAQQRIASAARVWIAGHPLSGGLTYRFDIIAVRPRRFPDHIINAFEVDF